MLNWMCKQIPFYLMALLIAAPMTLVADDSIKAEPEKGIVVFYRPRSAKGAAIRFEINHGDKGSLGNLSNGKVVEEFFEPGSHTFTTRSPSVDGHDSITITVSAGETHYIKGSILWGWPAGRPKFSRVSEEEAKADIEKL